VRQRRGVPWGVGYGTGVPVLVLVLFGVGGLVRWVWRLVGRYPVVAVCVVGGLLVVGRFGWGAVDGVAGLAGCFLLSWRVVDPAGFQRRVGLPVWSWWLARTVYARWPVVLSGCGLGMGADRRGRLVVPVLARVVRLRWSDRLLVGLLAGQAPADLEGASDRIAHGLGSRSCRVWPAGPGWVWVELARGGDPLAARFSLTVPSRPAVRLGGVPVGVDEEHELWRLPVQGAHILVAGSTGAGKGSVLWSLVRGLAPAIADGTVRVWAVDPKGGMELGSGVALFSRFATSAAGAAELLADAVSMMQERASRLAGQVRQAELGPAEPLVLVLIDELAALVSYEPDAKVRDRVKASLQLLLSQGRAPGFAVVAAVQDPRKDKVPFRELFPVRVALRLDEASQVDLVLGDDARKRGAACEEIPRSTPGVGYVRVEGQAAAVRVRAGWVSDDDIVSLAGQYAAPGGQPEGGTAGAPIF
jgi:DNA segregation ATPase FtsK/SpoIIIE, S-DNA-T family